MTPNPKSSTYWIIVLTACAFVAMLKIAGVF